MNTKQIKQIILLIIAVVFIAASGIIFAADGRAKTAFNDKSADLSRQQGLLTRGLEQKAAKEKEQQQLQQELANTQQALASVDFIETADSIEYDSLLYKLADEAKLIVTRLTFASPVIYKEKNITYKNITFVINLEGLAPSAFFQTTADSKKYVDEITNNIRTFIDLVCANPELETAEIERMEISAPPPMTDDELVQLQRQIYTLVSGEFTEQEFNDKTEIEKAAMVEARIAGKSSSQIMELMEKTGLDKVILNLTVKIWTYKEA